MANDNNETNETGMGIKVDFASANTKISQNYINGCNIGIEIEAETTITSNFITTSHIGIKLPFQDKGNAHESLIKMNTVENSSEWDFYHQNGNGISCSKNFWGSPAKQSLSNVSK